MFPWEQPMTRRLEGALAAAVLVGWVLACGGNSTSAPKKTGKPLDAGAYLACQKFSALARDLGQGVVTDAELRAGIREVYDEAKTRPNSEVTVASAALLRSLLRGTTNAEVLAPSMQALVDACRDWSTRPVR
jgi:hypothetical protein